MKKSESGFGLLCISCWCVGKTYSSLLPLLFFFLLLYLYDDDRASHHHDVVDACVCVCERKAVIFVLSLL